MERIERAAIRIDGEVWDVPRPGRHNNIIRLYCKETKAVDGIPPRYEQKSVQGFVTSEGRFVDRIEAARIAYEAGQTKEPLKHLFSEDVW